MLNLPCDTRNRSLLGTRGRLQAAHLSGPRSVTDAASSGPTLKAPGLCRGILTDFKHLGYWVLHMNASEASS
jgi:hypothetical protein